MRLWHQALIPYLDNKRLCAQHRECCALRGKGWGRKHATVDYVFKYEFARLYEYHCIVMLEIARRFKDFQIDGQWYNRLYRGKRLPQFENLGQSGTYIRAFGEIIYPEHNDKYLKECLLNLKSKGAELVGGKTVDGMLLDLDLNGIA